MESTDKISNPVFSIITVVFNRKESLEKTILSVINQTYKNINFVIIDGGSTDGTIDVIKKYSNNISYWVSETDNGIYDAMNKGLKAAKGDYVWFINSGDEIFDKDILLKLKVLNISPDIYYGDIAYIDENGNYLGTRKLKKPPEVFTWKNLLYGMVVSHQSFLIKRDKAVYFDTNYKHCADIDWMINSMKNCLDIFNTKLTLAKFLVGGYSKRNIIKSNRERYRILSKNFGFFQVIRSHIGMGINFMKYYFTNKRKLY
jgi:glycosyltransferase involved in cell wall biosynthesis